MGQKDHERSELKKLQRELAGHEKTLGQLKQRLNRAVRKPAAKRTTGKKK